MLFCCKGLGVESFGFLFWGLGFGVLGFYGFGFKGVGALLGASWDLVSKVISYKYGNWGYK